MRPAAVEAIAAARRFLETTILPSVPAEHRSELRAALKNLRTAELELAEVPGVLCTEIDELGELTRSAHAALGLPQAERHTPAGSADLAQLRDAHAGARRAAAGAILALQEHAREPSAGDRAEALELLARFYAALGRHAERRLPWQSVFPVRPDRAEHLVNCG